ncbi:hypothetical protein EJ06DRAFT_527105 [Trichodelitschia bisporula]|uniref:Meiotically up-regulated gene 154 protein n=1 Tax=Trichodelitschia bisporula TaxID=703511 RepID=A0A6G1I5L7_9PEZI|nr:hypothetical protein EJ06DRAFT_527105 [Trichodelitschia bisporula]
MSRRLVRRAPLSERIQAYLNPFDFLLWLSEELNSDDWGESKKWMSVPIGFGLNFIFLAARANSGLSSGADDVFGESYGSSGWFSWFCAFVVHALAISSIVNAGYTFTRKRYYRFFESSVEQIPPTPSARRVRVDSSPSSPLHFISKYVSSSSAQSRAHPDAARDVIELGIWDPSHLCLRLFCLFSPGHVFIYWLFLPLSPLDPSPTLTIIKTILLTSLLSVQSYAFQSFFTQQTHDKLLLNKEVLHEYDTKFVRPTLNRPVRDVGVQTPSSRGTPVKKTSEVDIYTPHTIVNRGFTTRPNPAYASQYDPDNLMHRPTNPRPMTTPVAKPRLSDAYTSSSTTTGGEFASPNHVPLQQPKFPTPHPHAGDGGSLGVYTHAASPLRKAASSNFLRQPAEDTPRTRGTSPLKRVSTPAGFADIQNGVAGSSGTTLNQRLLKLRGEGRRQSGGI